MAKTKHKTEDPEAVDETAEDAGEETGATPTPVGVTETSDGPEDTIERVPEPDEDEDEEDDDVALTPFDEDAAEEAGQTQQGNITFEEWRRKTDELAKAETSTDDLALPEPPALSTDDEYTAYLCGYRAGEDDPGYLLTLAEVGRHLGSFLTSEEEEIFLRLAADDWWGRWALGYSDGIHKRAKRSLARPTEAMDW